MKRPARSIPNRKWIHPPAPSKRRRPCGGRGLDDRRLRPPLLWKIPPQAQAQMRSAAARQSHGALLAQFSRSLASFVAVERSRVDLQSISELVIEPASTLPFVPLTLFLFLYEILRAQRAITGLFLAPLVLSIFGLCFQVLTVCAFCIG